MSSDQADQADQAERDLAMVIGCHAAREVRALVAAMIAETRSIKLPEVSMADRWFPHRIGTNACD